MSYATVAELLNRFDAEEIAQRADRSIPRLVSADLLRAAAGAEDLSAYTAAEQSAASTALAVVTQALADADSTIDGYLSSRQAVPLASPKFHRFADGRVLVRQVLEVNSVFRVLSTTGFAESNQARDVASHWVS